MIKFIAFARSYAMITIVTMHVLMHTWDNRMFQRFLSFGGTGVHLFFLLSGFCLVLGSYSTTFNFYRKRFTKILIPYWIAVTLLFVLRNTFFAADKGSTWYEYFGHIFLFKMFDASIFFSIGYEFWFLSPLIQFYIVFPLLRLIMLRTDHRIFMAAGIAISIIWWICEIVLGWGNIVPLRNCFLHYLWIFVVGMVLSKYHTERNIQFWNMSWLTALILVVLGYGTVIVFSGIKGDVFKIVNDFPLAVGYTGLMVLVFKTGQRVFMPAINAITNLGDLSYNLYLLHGIAMLLGYTLARKTSIPHSEAIAAPFILVFAYFSAHGYRSILRSWLRLG